MPRIVKPAADRQDEILDVAQALFLQFGYESTPIQAVIDRVGIAKGTFYHHYPSKAALLDALVSRTVAQARLVMTPILDEPLPAVEKLNALFLRTGAWKVAQKELMTEMHRALHLDANLALRLKLERDSVAAVVPLMGTVIRQGVAEGVFDTAYPLAVARIVMDLGVVLSHTLGDALLAGNPPSRAEVVTEIEAFHDAVERLLGAAKGSVRMIDISHISEWFDERRAG